MTGPARCTSCGTELADFVLSCPACGALTHSARLRALAESADGLAAAGKLGEARDAWREALTLLPRDSQQHRQVSARVDDLTRQLDVAVVAPPPDGSTHPWWKRGAAGAIAVAGVLIGKAKFLALGLLKAKTLFSMLAFAGVYWTSYGWPLAVGLVLSIYVHEMGHVAMLKHLGIAADAPLFIPGVGALVMLKQRVDDPVVDARIGLAGPLWGLGAGLVAFAIAAVTGRPTWRAIAELTGFINLFNLIPVWQLDGSRGFHALSRAQRFVVVAAVAIAFMMTGQKLLILVGAVALFRAFQPNDAAGDARSAATFVALVASLSWLARQVG